MSVQLKLKVQFITIVSTVITFIVLLSAVAFIGYEKYRTELEIHEHQEVQVNSVFQLLDIINQLMVSRTKTSLALLDDRTQRSGPPVLGKPISVNGRIVNNLVINKIPQAFNYDIVDKHIQQFGGTATIFVADGSDYVRISTNVRSTQDRIVGTVLDPNGKAYSEIRMNRSYYGVVDIVGEPYLAGYEPIHDNTGKIIGVLYVGYKMDMELLTSIIKKSPIIDNGFIALLDHYNLVRYKSNTMSDQAIQASIHDKKNWSTYTKIHPAWNFTVISGYAVEDIKRQSYYRASIIVLGLMMVTLILVTVVGLMLRRVKVLPSSR